VALPAAICNFTDPVAFFAMMPFRTFINSTPSLGFRLSALLRVATRLLSLPAQIPARPESTAEDRNHDFQSLAILVHVIDNSGKGCERTLANAHRFAFSNLT